MSKRLYKARDNAGYSRQQLAALIGASPKTIYNYESSSYRRTRKAYVVKAWAEACNVPFEAIWGPPDRRVDSTGWLEETGLRERLNGRAA